MRYNIEFIKDDILHLHIFKLVHLKPLVLRGLTA